MLLFSLGLIEYFSQHLGEYENVLAALEDLNLSILKAMDKTKKVSPAASILWSFWREHENVVFGRFFLVRISNTSRIYRCGTEATDVMQHDSEAASGGSS